MGQRTVLFLAYMFPPVGGGGVQRSLKFVKYLPRMGWNPVVVTVRPITYYVYDPKLLGEVPNTVEVARTHSLDPLRLSALVWREGQRAGGDASSRHSVFSEASRLVRIYRSIRRFVFFPDAQLGWIPFAFKKGLELIRNRGVSIIYSPGAPYSSAVTAYLLSKYTGLPYVVDFRDGWTDDAYHTPPTAAHKAAHKYLERVVVTNASAICVYGKWLGRQLADRYPKVAGRIVEITNGFDPADLENAESIPRSVGKRRIVYSGSLYSHHREVFKTILEALNKLSRAERDGLELIVVGQFYQEAVQDIGHAMLEGVVQLKGYLPHSTALGYVMSSDAALLLVRKGDFASATGKIFELLMTRRPIIALAEPKGECARILQIAGADDYLYSPDDAQGASESFRALLSGQLVELRAESVAQFSRITQTSALASVLERSIMATTTEDSLKSRGTPKRGKHRVANQTGRLKR